MTSRVPLCQFIPPYLIERLQPDRLALDERLRTGRAPGGRPVRRSVLAGAPAWVVHTCDNTSELPGTVVRSAGQAQSGDPAVDEAAAGITETLALYQDVYGRDSYDGRGAPVSLSVHFERDYDNAYWDGTQLVFGDGDGQVFGRFTDPVDVLGHEFTHAVTEHTAGLDYVGQSGALNESVSDVFGSCLKQRLLGQGVDEADWLVGQGIFLPGVQGLALRDMLHPGTAYDDPRLGKDPQVGDMADYVDTSDDNGGVHLNSGIPNRAFVLAAKAIGGTSWEGAGRIWYATLTGGSVSSGTDFAGFAAATIAAAGEHADAVREAWSTVGVTPVAGSVDHPAAAVAGVGASVPWTVSVRRTGGVAGLRTEGTVDLESDDDRAPELMSLVRRVDLGALEEGTAHPDRYVYEFDVRGTRRRVPEQHLTPELKRIIDLVLQR